MGKNNKKDLQLLLLAALIGFLGSYTATYFYEKFNIMGYKNVVGPIFAVLFFLLVILISKVAEPRK